MARTLTGIVSSDKANKTIVVTVHLHKTHPLYKKAYSTTKKFIAHDEQNQAKVGDKVTIVETKPLSARKRFTLQSVDEATAIAEELTVDNVTAEPKDQKEDSSKEETS
jgi:small subunit ribosomal protein S17